MYSPTAAAAPTWSSIASSSAQSNILLRSRRPLAPTAPAAHPDRSDTPPPFPVSQSDFDKLALSTTSYDLETSFPTLPIVDPLPHLFRDDDDDGQSRPRRGRQKLAPPPPELKLQEGATVGRDKEGRVLMTGWVEQHEVARLLGGGGDDEPEIAAKPVPIWEKNEDGLVKWRKEDFECAVCLEPFTMPHTITCGHTFCKSCVDAISTYKCPVCRQSFGVAYPNLFLKTAMERWEGAERVV